MKSESIRKGHIKFPKRSINKDEYPHEINVILDQYGFRSLKELAKQTRSEKILESLVDEYWDTDYMICKYVAYNFATPLDLLIRLSKHPSEEVRIAVASKTDLDIRTSFKMVFDSSILVRQALARKCKYENVNKFLLQFYKTNSMIVNSILIRPENRNLILKFINSENLDVINAFLANTSFNNEYLRAVLELQLENSEYHFIDKVFNHVNFSEELGFFVLENFGSEKLNEDELNAIKSFIEK